jgi:quinol monooxygenase YgiN
LGRGAAISARFDEENTMRAIWVKIRIKPAERERFLQAIEVDALRSERDEPGCLCFNVLQDLQDENTYYCYEVFTDEAAMEAHRATPHFAVWRAVADALDGPSEVTRCRTIFPADREYWGKPTELTE